MHGGAKEGRGVNRSQVERGGEGDEKVRAKECNVEPYVYIDRCGVGEKVSWVGGG